MQELIGKRICFLCKRKERLEWEFGVASMVEFCPPCSVQEGNACSACGCDQGNGCGGYSNCCGALVMSALPDPDRVREQEEWCMYWKKVFDSVS